MKNNNQKRILFLLKKSVDSAGGGGSRAGLINAAQFVVDYLSKKLGIQAYITTTVDGNSITQDVKRFQPDIVVLEALWCPPYKIAQLADIYPNVQWVVRIHSKIPFLASEGIAMDWLSEYHKIKNTTIAFNSKSGTEDFNKLGYESIYLPNIYFPAPTQYQYSDIDKTFAELNACGCPIVHVGCFGALRPMKNQLNQAIAAIEYANLHSKKLVFHVNVGPEDIWGDQIIKNLRSLFESSNGKHQLQEWPWLDHEKFRYLIKKMNFGMQVSLSESFNIVTADFVESNVPVIASKEIDWMPEVFRADPASTNDIQYRIRTALMLPKLTKFTNYKHLDKYNHESAEVWELFLKFHDF